MFLRKIRVSITKLILPPLYKIFQLLKATSRAVNFLNDKKVNANNGYNFQVIVDKLLKDEKLIGLDVGAQGGFNSDKFFPEKYNKYFNSILVEPLKDSFKDEKNEHIIINKGLWSSPGPRKLYILNKRPHSSSMYEPNKEVFDLYNIKEKNYELFKVSKTTEIECTTIKESLNEISLKNLDFLKIDTQGSELEILKGLGNYFPLLIKIEVQIIPMYKNVPNWSELLNHIYKLNYMICDWSEIGTHATHTPAEMDMLFIPNYLNENGKQLILSRENRFISLMVIFGQIRLLKIISSKLNFSMDREIQKLQDKFFY